MLTAKPSKGCVSLFLPGRWRRHEQSIDRIFLDKKTHGQDVVGRFLMIKYEQNLCTLFCSSFGTMRLNINKMNVIFFESSMSAFLTKHINRQPPETIQYTRCSKKMARNLHDLLKTTQADHKPTYHGQQDTASLLCIFDIPEHPCPFEDIARK